MHHKTFGNMTHPFMDAKIEGVRKNVSGSSRQLRVCNIKSSRLLRYLKKEKSQLLMNITKKTLIFNADIISDFLKEGRFCFFKVDMLRKC